MTVAEAIRKFKQFARLCPYLVPTDEHRVKKMLEMFRPDITLAIESGGDPPTTTMNCVECTYMAEHYLNQLKEKRRHLVRVRKDKVSWVEIGIITTEVRVCRVTDNRDITC